MIFFHPVHGPDAADLAALELRREGDADIADLLAVIRRLSKGYDPETRDLKLRLRETEEELDGINRELEELQEENRKLGRKSEDLRKDVKAKNEEIRGLVAKNAKLGTIVAYLEGRAAQAASAAAGAPVGVPTNAPPDGAAQ